MYKIDDITIIDNFLEKKTFLKLVNYVGSDMMMWRVGKGHSKSDESTEMLVDHKHDWVTYNKLFERKTKNQRLQNGFLIKPFTEILGVSDENVLRAMMIAEFCKDNPYKLAWHLDVKGKLVGNGMTAVYYYNTNNGKTVFKNGHEVESVANRIVIFPNDWHHTGQYQTDAPVRYVLNLNWALDKSSEP